MTATVPTAGEVATILGKIPADVDDVYPAEVADQAARCRTVPYNDALAGALVRRVSRHLAMKNLPLGVVVDETGSTRIGTNDPEVRRLEAPYRKTSVG